MINNKEEMLRLSNSAKSKVLVILTKLRLAQLEVTLEFTIIRFIIEPTLMLQRECFQIGHIVRVRKVFKIDSGRDPSNAIALKILIHLDPFKKMKIPGEVFLQPIIPMPKRLPKIAFLCK